MDNYEGEDEEFSSEEVQKIAQSAVELVVKGDSSIAYQKDKVNQWCQ